MILHRLAHIRKRGGRLLASLCTAALIAGFIPYTVHSPATSFVASAEFPYPGLDGPVNAAEISPDGRLFIAGGFNAISGMPADGLAVLEDGEWSTAQFNALPEINEVWDIHFDQAGRTYISAEFARYPPAIAIGFDGGWRRLDGPFSKRINFDVTPAGEIYAGECSGSSQGSYGIGVKYWDGDSWTTLQSLSCVYEVHADSRGRAFVSGGSGFDNSTVVFEDATEIARSMRVRSIESSESGEVYAILPAKTGDPGGIGRWSGTDWDEISESEGQATAHLAIDDEGRPVRSREPLSGDGPQLVIERWNGSAWTTIYDDSNPGEFDGSIADIEASGDRGLIVVGGIHHRTRARIRSVLVLENGTWESPIPMWGGPNKPVSTLEEHEGRLYIGGQFERVDDQFMNGLAVYEDGEWTNIGGAAPFAGYVSALGVAHQDDIYAGGRMYRPEFEESRHVLHWNGDAWSPLGTGVEGPPAYEGWPQVYDLALDGNSGVWVGGHFERAGGLDSPRLAHWNGSSWTAMSIPYEHLDERTIVQKLETCPDGSLIVGLQARTNGSGDPVPLPRWDGAEWTILGRFYGEGRNTSVISINCTGNDITVGGSFSVMDGQPVRNVARLQNGSWSDLDGGINAPVRDMLTSDDGSSIMIGGFTEAGGKSVVGVAVWDGSWSPFESDNPPDRDGVLRAISPDGEGGIFIGGRFRSTGSIAASNLVRYSRKPGNDLPARAAVRSAGVFPNPLIGGEARLDLTLTEAGTYDASVFDIAGRKRAVLFTGRRITPASGFIEIAVGDLPAGHYFILLRSAKETRAIPFAVIN